jgi:hypothetical protein
LHGHIARLTAPVGECKTDSGRLPAKLVGALLAVLTTPHPARDG